MSAFAAMATILISLITFVDADVFNVHSSTNEFEISIVIIILTTTVITALYSVILMMAKSYKKTKDETNDYSKEEK